MSVFQSRSLAYLVWIFMDDYKFYMLICLFVCKKAYDIEYVARGGDDHFLTIIY